MKRLLTVMLILVSAILASGQEYRYKRTCGKDVSYVLYKTDLTGFDLFIQIEQQESWHKFDSEHRNVYWKIVDPRNKMSVEITLEDGEYHVCGTNNGKKLDKRVKSEGWPWFQNIAYLCGKVVPEDGPLKYECFLPGSFSLHTMTISRIPQECSADRICVRARPTGIASKLYHADYFFSPVTGTLTGYSAVEGIPGTPVTTWTIINP